MLSDYDSISAVFLSLPLTIAQNYDSFGEELEYWGKSVQKTRGHQTAQKVIVTSGNFVQILTRQGDCHREKNH